MKNKKTIDLTTGPLLGKIVLFTIPILLTGILQLLFNAVDMVVVGRFCGSTSLAAVGSTGSITNLVVCLFMGLSVSSGIMISHAVGGRQKKEIDRVLHTSTLSSFLIGAVLGVIGFIITPWLLKLTNTPDDVIGKATTYMRIIFIGMPVNMLFNFCASMLRSTGDSIRPLIYLVIAGITNVVLNVILVTIVNLDVAGVAIATIVSQAISAFLIVYRLAKGTEHLKLKRYKLHISMPHLKKLMSIGIPAGVQSMMFSISNTIIQSSINSFGTAAIAGNSAGSSIDGFLYMSMNSFYQAAITAAGQNMGAHRYGRIARSAGVCLIAAAFLGFALGLFSKIFAPELLSIYTTDAEAIEVGIMRLNIMGSFYLLCGLMEVLVGIIRGMGHSFTTMIVSIIGVCGIRIVWIYTIFQKIHTLECLYFSYIVSWAFVIIVDAIMLAVYLQKLKRTPIQQ
ncbi:MAG: MATE family efflux transporter [Clostridia bacterium]|nr:MATE family efflux transporter [Clostridia bacterium]